MLKQTSILKNANSPATATKTKIQALKFINPQAQGLSSNTWGVVRKELRFKYRDSLQAAQSRPSEAKGKK